jgi:Pyruvate/2-oxoacid:ferredoxin oxidoreductase gamma subunit
MERELLMTGIGGQGIQLSARCLAEAAISEGRTVRMFGSYGGMMRGGNTDATLIVGTGPIATPPVIAECWAAIVMHHDYADHVWERLRADGVALVTSTVVTSRPDDPAAAVIDVPAADLAVEVGNIMAASMVMVGAFAATTALVTLDGLARGVETAIPSYRRQNIELNLTALQTGFDAVEAGTHQAWTGAEIGS